MNAQAWTGKLVRLTLLDPEKDAETIVRWDHSSRYQLLANGTAPRLWSAAKVKEWLEKEPENQNGYFLMIRTLEDDRPIGTIGLEDIHWAFGEAWVGIGIGEEADWGKGYGTDAMNIILRFAFQELNLHRVSLNVFQFNERAIRSYEKLGFQTEGRVRQWMQRDGVRYDLIYMGILNHEWQALQEAAQETTTARVG